MKRTLVPIFLTPLLILSLASAEAGSHQPTEATKSWGQISAGPVFTKIHQGHWENGMFLAYTHPKLWRQKIRLSLNYQSNQFGSRMGSDRIFPRHALEGRALVHFRPQKLVDPFLGMGWSYGRIFFNTTDPVEREFAKKYQQKSSCAVVSAGTAWNIHPTFGNLWTGLSYDLSPRSGPVYPLSIQAHWEFPLWPRSL